MGYYCTVPQCTSLAGKTKNVKFHRFPRDVSMADKWNVILKRGKPYTKYSKVCSLHFTQSDYNVTNMGQWKTLSKDAVPSQNLPKLNPDGTVMVIRKSRTLKYKDGRKDESTSVCDKWSGVPSALPETPQPETDLAYRLQTLHAIANSVSPHPPPSAPLPLPLPLPLQLKKKQDAFMQTDPELEDNDNDNDNSYEGGDTAQRHTDQTPAPDYPQPIQQYKEPEKYEQKSFEPPKDYTKPFEASKDYAKTFEASKDYAKTFEASKDYAKPNEDYIPQTNEEYNKEAEKYALGRKSLAVYDKEYQKMDYSKVGDVYAFSEKQEFRSYYLNGYPDSADILRNQQHNLQLLQEQHRAAENQSLFTDGIKQELDLSGEEDKLFYERGKEGERDALFLARRAQRALEAPQVKQEPEGCENVLQPQGSPYGYANGLNSHVQAGYYEQLSRPGPEMLIAKQNALAAHQQLWQNTMKRPFFYSENPHYNGPPLLHRYEDIPRILQ